MKIIFFGLGSIGNRHAKILLSNYNHEVFAYRTNKGQEKNHLGIKEVYSWRQIKKIKPDIAFITNPTFLHIKVALKCAKLNMDLFMEKPIDCSERNLDLLLREVSKRKLTTYVAYVLRFHPAISFLKKYLESKKVYHVSVYNSSFLPSWRPNQNHLKSYSSQKNKGGGVILDLSHEFDYLEYLFGKIISIRGFFGKASSVTKDAEDFMDAVILTKHTTVNLHQNFLSLRKERSIKIDCQDEFIFADLVKGKIESISNGKKMISKKYIFDSNDIFKKQIKFFFDNIKNVRMMNNLHDASILFRKILTFKKRKK